MGRSLRISLRAIYLLSLLLGAQYTWGATVGLLVDEPSQQIQAFHKQLQTQLTDDTLKLVPLNQFNANELGNFQKWITLGPNSLKALVSLGQTKSSNVLSLFLPDSAKKSLNEQYPNSFTYLDNSPSIARQLALVKEMMPQANHVGVYYSAMFKLDKTQYSNIAKQYGLTLHWAELKDPLNWDRNALRVLNSVDIVMGVDDSALYNTTTIRSILMRLYRSGKALVGPDKGYVRAGAVSSVYSGVAETIQACAYWLNLKSPSSNILSNPYFNVSINTQVARSLNIVIQDEASLVKSIKERANEK